MAKKKVELLAETDTVQVTLELTTATLTQIENIAKSWGYTVQEWFAETIANNL